MASPNGGTSLFGTRPIGLLSHSILTENVNRFFGGRAETPNGSMSVISDELETLFTGYPPAYKQQGHGQHSLQVLFKDVGHFGRDYRRQGCEKRSRTFRARPGLRPVKSWQSFKDHCGSFGYGCFKSFSSASGRQSAPYFLASRQWVNASWYRP
jgi:hypothetical protein